jgi:hypothetical protein
MRRPYRRPDKTGVIHHRPEKPNNRGLMQLNLLGLLAALLVAAFMYFLWIHPAYVPACAQNGRGHCPAGHPRPSP